MRKYIFGELQYTENIKSEQKGIILDDVVWITQEEGRCTYACKSIVSSYSNSERKLETKGALTPEQIVIMNKANNDCSSFIATSSFDLGIQTLDKQLLVHKVPVTVGVYRPTKKTDPSTKEKKIENQCLTYNEPTEASTGHFIVVIGIGYEGNRKYYRFLDVGATNITDGNNENNKLYLDGKQIKGTSNYFDGDGRFYIVTEIRETVITKK